MSETPWKFFVTDSYSEATLSRLRAAGEVVYAPDATADQPAQAIADCDALLVRTRSRVTAQLLSQAKRLKVVGRAGVGLDTIDVDAAHKLGIQVVYTPAASTDAVAELAVGLLIGMVRELLRQDHLIRHGRFGEARTAATAPELSELTLGIIGMGRIGKAFARRCNLGLGMPIVFHDIADVGPLDFAATAMTLADVLATADVVSLHVPLTDQTSRMINARSLEAMKPGAWLINTARGAVLDSSDVASALRSGHLAGAGLDVLDTEPPPEDHPLLLAPNVLLTAHVGSKTRAADARMEAVVDDVLAVLRGEQPRFPAWP